MENRTQLEAIKSNVWVRVTRDPETQETIIHQGSGTTLADAIGMLRYAIITYETKYNVNLEYSNLELLKSFLDNLASSVSQIKQDSKMIETAMLRTAALSQNAVKKG